jgi:hypothetical protein
MKVKYRKHEVAHRSIVAKLLREYRLQQNKLSTLITTNHNEVRYGRR